MSAGCIVAMRELIGAATFVHGSPGSVTARGVTKGRVLLIRPGETEQLALSVTRIMQVCTHKHCSKCMLLSMCLHAFCKHGC